MEMTCDSESAAMIAAQVLLVSLTGSLRDLGKPQCAGDFWREFRAGIVRMDARGGCANGKEPARSRAPWDWWRVRDPLRNAASPALQVRRWRGAAPSRVRYTY